MNDYGSDFLYFWCSKSLLISHCISNIPFFELKLLFLKVIGTTASNNTVYYVIPQKGVTIPRPVAPATASSKDVATGSKDKGDNSVAIHIPGLKQGFKDKRDQ